MKPLYDPGLASLIAGNAVLVGLLWLIFRLPPLPAVNCVHPLVQSLVPALGITLVLNLLAAFFVAKQYGWTVAVLALLLILTWWLGSYPYSPLLGFANGDKPVLTGFRIMRSGRADVTIAPGDTISLSCKSFMYIEALVELENARCLWQSARGGALDGPDTCNPVYAPPQGANFDILKVHIVPGCQLAESTGQIKISILP
jgi:hypothetical protein